MSECVVTSNSRKAPFRRHVWYGLLVFVLVLNHACASNREAANGSCKWTLDRLAMEANKVVSRAGGSAEVERVGESLVLKTPSGEGVGNGVQAQLDEVAQSLLQRNEQACRRLKEAPRGDWRKELYEKELSTLWMIWTVYSMDLKRAIEKTDINMTEEELRAIAAKYIAASRKRGVMTLGDVSPYFRSQVSCATTHADPKLCEQE